MPRAVVLRVSLLFLVACSAGDTQRAAICERAVAIDTAIARTGELPQETKTMNAAVLRNQLDEDMRNLTAALDIAPKSIVTDISTVLSRLRNLYGSLELVDWDAARFVSNDRLDEALASLGSVNTRRHLARLSGYLVEACEDQTVGGSVPPDTVVATPPSSTSISVADDPIPEEQDLLTVHVAMGTAIAESLGIPVTVDQAECLGSEADLVTVEAEDVDPADWQRRMDQAFLAIFPKCGLSVPDRPTP